MDKLNFEIEEYYSCCEWSLINIKDRDKLTEITKKNNVIDLKTIVINDYLYVEGDVKKTLLNQLDFYYYFKIDIWIPTMTFTFFEKKTQREISSYLNIEEQEIIEKERGKRITYENGISILETNYGYDNFFYPLYIFMNIVNDDKLIFEIISTEQ